MTALEFARANLLNVLRLAYGVLAYLGVPGKVEAVYLQGSRAEARATEKSDWDFLIVGEGFGRVNGSRWFNASDLPPYLAEYRDEWKRRSRAGCIDLQFSDRDERPDEEWGSALLVYPLRGESEIDWADEVVDG